MPLSTIFQLYCGSQFYWYLVWVGFELTMLVVISINCIGSHKSNYHTITAMTRECTCTFIYHNYYITILYSIFDFNSLMTNLFWPPTKTINFFRSSWLTDIKSVRSISYDFFCPKINPPDSICRASSQLTTSIHWSCYCTVNVYVIFPFLWWYVVFLSGSESGQVFIICLYTYSRWRSSYQEGMVVIPLTGLILPPFCACPKLGPGFPTP